MIGLVSGVIAILVGAWRQMCIVLEVRAPFELPSAWRSVGVRLITWAASTGFSVFFAFVVTGWIIANELPLGPFWFGVLLVLRWFASSLFAGTVLMKNINLD